MADDRWRGDDWRRPDEDRYRYGGPGFGQGWQGYGQGMPSGMGYGQGGMGYGPVYGAGGTGYGTSYGQSGMPYGQSGAGYGQSYGQGSNYAQGGYGQSAMAGATYEQSRFSQGPYAQDYNRPWSGHGGGYSGRYSDDWQRMRGGYGQGYAENPDFRRDEWRGSYGSSREYQGGASDWRGRPEEDRSWWNRATDEVASWVGDEDAERRRRMDQQRGYYGRGPRGYTRPDERIREDVNDGLTFDPSVDATEIVVIVDKGEVTLSGTVGSREERRRAEDVAENVSGVKHVQNNVRVQDQGTSSSSTGSSSGTSGTTTGRSSSDRSGTSTSDKTGPRTTY